MQTLDRRSGCSMLHTAVADNFMQSKTKTRIAGVATWMRLSCSTPPSQSIDTTFCFHGEQNAKSRCCATASCS
eukprot:6189288-Pleurochrysis_carterae.AAC.1